MNSSVFGRLLMLLFLGNLSPQNDSFHGNRVAAGLQIRTLPQISGKSRIFKFENYVPHQILRKPKFFGSDSIPVSYTHLTLPTNREV